MVDPDRTEGGRRVIPPGGVRALVVVTQVVVLTLTGINAGRGEWGLAINGVVLAAWISVTVVWLRPPPKV